LKLIKLNKGMAAFISIAVLAIGGRASAQDSEQNGWFVRTGPVAVIFNPRISLSLGGADVPGADVTIDNNYSETFELGYRFNRNWSVIATVGLPPWAELDGAGTISSAGTIGEISYGPSILAAQYRFPIGDGRFEPYIGAGINYTIVLDEKDRAASGVNVKSAFGPVLQVGFEYMFNNKMGMYFDVKKVWLNADATASLGGAPVKANVTLDPLLIGTGLVWRF